MTKDRFPDVQPAMAHAARNLDRDVPLGEAARRAHMSPYHFHRVFSAVAGETPKQFSLRLRLGRATSLLLTRNDTILDVALACGFQSHEGFIRAFRRTFGIRPSAYRARGFGVAVTDEEADQHTALVEGLGRCVGLFRYSPQNTRASHPMSYDITTKEIEPQAVLVERRNVTRSEISATIGEVVGRLFQHAQANGLALAGYPFTRYHEMTPGSMIIEPGMRIVSGDDDAPPDPAPVDDPATDTPRRDVLPGGTVATTIHSGPYEKLGDAYAAVEVWMKAEGLSPAGAPWECYLNSPTDHEDPAEWKTEVFWPVR